MRAWLEIRAPALLVGIPQGAAEHLRHGLAALDGKELVVACSARGRHAAAPY